MKRISANLLLAAAFACSTVAQPVVTTVVNKASYSAVLSPNSVPYGQFEAAVSTFSLYVDGQLIVSEGLPYLLYQRAPANPGPRFSYVSRYLDPPGSVVRWNAILFEHSR
jgi:hypothetical protein